MKIEGVLCLMVLAVVCLFSNGCQEAASSDQILQARLVGNENLLLKKQVQEKDSQINDKNTLINNKDAQIAELTKQLELSKLETAKALDRSAQLEKTFSEASAAYQRQMEDYQKSMGEKPVPCPEVEAKYAAEFASLLEKWTDCETKLEKYQQTDNK